MAYGGPDHEEFFGGDQAAENADYELNARYDYLAELAAEHADPEADYEQNDNGEWVRRPRWVRPVHAKAPAPLDLGDDEIPF